MRYLDNASLGHAMLVITGLRKPGTLNLFDEKLVIPINTPIRDVFKMLKDKGEIWI
jgi:hypothetical protein